MSDPGTSTTFEEPLPPSKVVHAPRDGLCGEVVKAQDGRNLVIRGEIGSGSHGTVLLCEEIKGDHQQHQQQQQQQQPHNQPATASSSSSAPLDDDLARLKIGDEQPGKGGDVALKVLYGDASDSNIKRGKQEEALLREAVHPNVVKVHSSWETSKAFHLAMEYAGRGDAFDIVDFYNGGCPEPLAGKVALGLFRALAHIHSKGIVHRDVKPENVFIKDDGDVVLGDFGLAGKKTEEELLRTPCGTITYRAPEIVRGDKYGPEVDVWSAGLTIYTLLTGYDPWSTSGSKLSPAAVARKILAGQLNRFPSHVSSAAKDFVRACVCVDSKKRMSAEKALKHPWLKIAIVFRGDDLPSQEKLEKRNL